MTASVKIIFNARDMSSATKIVKLEQALRQANLSYSLDLTRYPQHATELARQAVMSGFSTVVAAGGDGTINEVVNGLLQTDKPTTLGIIPLGTANDLATMLKIPSNLTGACQRLALGQTLLIDVGQVNNHYFVNNSAIGLEPLVTLNQAKMRWLKGPIRYLIAALQTIAQTGKAWPMRLDWENGSYEGDVTLVSVGNGTLTGGFLMNPLAKVDDGLLDFSCGMGMYRVSMLAFVPLLIFGQHIKRKVIIYKQSSYLKVKSTIPTPIQADGEMVALEATEICYKILPKKLQVII